MNRTALLLLALAACDVGTLEVAGTDDTDVGIDDTEVTDPTDTDPAVPGDTDVTDPTDTDPSNPGDTDPSNPGDTDPSTPGPLSWDGKVEVTYDGWVGDPCTTTVNEKGSEVFGDAAKACPSCDHVFRLTSRTTGFCPGVGPTFGDVWKGLEDLGGGNVKVWTIDRGTFSGFSASELGTGTWTGGQLDYTYTQESWGFEAITGVGDATVQ